MPEIAELLATLLIALAAWGIEKLIEHLVKK